MGRQTSGKRGLQVERPNGRLVPPRPKHHASDRPGIIAFGKSDRVTPKRLPLRRPIGKRTAE